MRFAQNEIVDRLIEACGHGGDHVLASKFGMSRQNFAQRKKRGTLNQLIIEEAIKNGVNLQWLFTGQGEMKSFMNLACPCIEDFALIPKYATRLSVGPGAYVLSEDIENTMAFKKVWINQRCNKNGCGLFEVVGDSMAPAICHEDIVLVDMSKSDPKEIIEGKVYAFAEGDKVRIKRLMWKGQELWAVSENKAESPDGAVDVEGFRLIGKVIWVGHEVR